LQGRGLGGKRAERCLGQGVEGGEVDHGGGCGVGGDSVRQGQEQCFSAANGYLVSGLGERGCVVRGLRRVVVGGGASASASVAW
jgi:hypothetical protein